MLRIPHKAKEAAMSRKDAQKREKKKRKLAAPGKFLAGREMYDKHVHMLPTGTVPTPNPKSQPNQGAITMDPREQYAGAPEAPVTPDPWGGTISESRAYSPVHEQEDSPQGTPR